MKKTPILLAITTAITTQATLAATELPKVIVTANNSEQNLKTVTSPITIITAEEIQEKQAHSLIEVLRNVPGIVIKSSGGPGTVSSIFMRGQSNSGVLILIDGIELTNPLGTGGARLEMISVTDIQRIEIIKGPQSGIWGSGSAGVINIITKKTGKNTASLEVGSFDFKQLSASLGSKTEKANFRINISDLQTEGFSRVKAYRHSNDGYENDAFNQTDISFALELTPIKNHTLSTFVKQTYAYTEYDSATDPNAAGIFNKTDFTQTLRKIELKSLFTQAISTTFYAQDNQLTHYGSEALTTQTGGKLHVNYRSEDFLNIEIQNKQLQQLNSNKSYYNLSYSINNTNTFGNLTLTQAIRQDQFNKFEDKTSGKIGAKYHFNPKTYISTNYGTAYNAPTLFQITYGTTQNLKPETSTGYDFSLHALGITLTYFNQEIDKQISYGGTWPNDYYYNRTDKTTAEGIELSYLRTIDMIDTDLSLNYLTQTVKDQNGQWLSHRPEQTANIQLTYFGLNKTLIGMNTNYIGNKYDKDNKKGANIGNYIVIDIFANYELNQSLTLKAKVKNLFNEDYTDAVASYVGNTNTPQYIYNNGGTQIFIGIDGNF